MDSDKMTSYERVMTALSLGKPDIIPIVENWNLFAFRNAGFTHAECILDGGKFVESQLKALADVGGDGVWGPSSSGFVAEACGGNMIVPEDNPTVPGEPIVNDLNDISSVDFHNVLEKGKVPAILKTISDLKKAAGKDVPIFCTAASPPMTASWLRGTEIMYRDFLRKPDLIEALIEKCVEPSIEYAKAVAEAGADVVWVPDPICGGSVISRRHYTRFAYPYIKQMFLALRKQGIKTVYHTCGDWNDRLDLASDGPDCLHLSKETDLAKVKAEYGRKVALMGNMTSMTFLVGKAEDVQAETLRCIEDGARGGGFILSGDCSIPPATSRENMLAVINVARP